MIVLSSHPDLYRPGPIRSINPQFLDGAARCYKRRRVFGPVPCFSFDMTGIDCLAAAGHIFTNRDVFAVLFVMVVPP